MIDFASRLPRRHSNLSGRQYVDYCVWVHEWWVQIQKAQALAVVLRGEREDPQWDVLPPRQGADEDKQ